MVPSPHDALFKAVFAQPEHARGALRAVLPVALADAIDWSTLALRPGSFVDASLRNRHTDLLYSAAWRDGGAAPVHVLFEHQSTPPTEAGMAHRLLRYQVRIWDRWSLDHPRAKTLPMILPVVLYHGAAPWLEPRSFDARIEVPAAIRPAVAPHMVRFVYLLQDLSEISDDELRDHPMLTPLTKLAVLCFKHARTRADFLTLLAGWMDIVREVARGPHGMDALAQVMRYVLEVNEHVGVESLRAMLDRELGSNRRDAIMTTLRDYYESGRLQGVEEGVRKGHKKGVREGRKRGAQQILLRQLRQRFGDAVGPEVERRIATASLNKIERWSERMLLAATLDEVVAP